jgi:rod shape-determining protein MreC
LSPFKPYTQGGGERGRKRDLRVAMSFIVLALVLVFIPQSFREALAQGIRGTLLRPVLAVQRGSLEREARFADPARLRAERDSLAAYLVGQAPLAAENRQLRSLLEMRGRLPLSFIPAEIVHIRDRGSEGAFMLTAGEVEGVTVGAPIVAAAGLVGMVRNVDRTVSLGIDWTHRDFRASAMTVDGETFGIVEPRRVGGEVLLAMAGAAFHTTLEEGTWIVTSGRGGVYPRGIPIGQVVASMEEEAGWRRSYLIRPAVGPAEMGYVLVLGAEAVGTPRDLAMSWGIRPEPQRPDTAEIGTLRATATGEAGEVEVPVEGTPQPTTTPAAPAAPAPRPQQPRLLGEPVQPAGNEP